MFTTLVPPFPSEPLVSPCAWKGGLLAYIQADIISECEDKEKQRPQQGF